jgi:membrane-associated phospholipid phosphatase
MPGFVMPVQVPSDDAPDRVVGTVAQPLETDHDESYREPDPFDAMPSARRLTITFLIGLLVMIASLSAVGVLITSTDLLAGVRNWDTSISTGAADGRTSEATDLARIITRAGDTLAIVALLAAVTVVLAVLRKWRAMVFLPVAMLAEITTFLTVNHIVGRERPDVERIGSLPSTNSFPSGHVAATLVCWIGISLLLAAYGFGRSARVVAAFGTLMAVAMGWARVYAGMHYTTDVIFGFVMGLAALLLAVVATGWSANRLDGAQTPASG